MRRVQEHWGLSGDPFGPKATSYVATPVHDEAVARIVHAVESGEPRIAVRAGAGLGKSAVLDRAHATLRKPSRSLVRIVGDSDLAASILDALGLREPRGTDPAATWRRLIEAFRAMRLQRKGLVVFIDDARPGHPDLARLVHVDPHPDARISVIEAGRDESEGSHETWSLAIRLAPLTRSESDGYLAAKLGAAGRSEPVFTPKAVARLHGISGGVPRGLDRLASLAMMAGAMRGLEIVTPDVVDGVAAECVVPEAA